MKSVGSQAAQLETHPSRLSWEDFGYIALRLSIAIRASRLIGIHGQVPEVTEIEWLELRFRNGLPVLLISRYAGDGHS